MTQANAEQHLRQRLVGEDFKAGSTSIRNTDRTECVGRSRDDKEKSNMPDILHRDGIKSSSPADAYGALSTIEGLSAWWTNDTQGDSDVDGVIQFRFEDGGIDMKVLELRPAKHVLWQVVDGPEEWIGTTVNWELREEGDYTIVLFRHQGWKEPVEFMYHCSTKWGGGVFLLSLKSLLETGTGAAAPNDLKLGNWN